MDSGLLSSPEQHGQSVTYKDKKKRKRAVSYQSDSESSIESKEDVPPTKNEDDQSINGKLKIAFSPTAHDTKESAKPKAKKARHTRNKSSVTSLKQVDKEMQEAPSTNKRQSSGASAIKARSKAKSIGDDEDDNVSIADSTISTGRVRRNEAERIQYFENQPECGKMEPHQVQCLRCEKSVNLGRKQTYAVRPWEIHRARCDQRPARKSVIMSEAKEVKDAVQTESPSAQVPASQPTPARRPSEQERKEFLESDNQIETVEKHRVSCRKCQTWVDLGHASSYATGNWVKHKVRCSAVMPSSRVAAAKRRLVLVNDSQAASFDSRSVGCALCGVNIVLEGEGDFNLTKWNEHKSTCIKPGPVSKNDGTNLIPFPGRSPPRPPLSSASTEDTLVVDAGLSGARNGLKRSREETESIPVDDMPKAVRPRTQSYLPPTTEPPNSLLGWFMLPFHSFVRGFNESLMERP